MPKQKVLSGKDVVSIFESLGFTVVSQKGSHIKLERITDDAKEMLIIPNHKELDRGTLRAIYTQSLKYVSVEILQKHFYVV